MREATYRRELIKRLKALFPDCYILNNDASSMQGVPDILILYGERWAMLEIKIDSSANIQPNQEYYVKMFGEMSFASFINPETEEDVLRELQRAFRSGRKARIS